MWVAVLFWRAGNPGAQLTGATGDHRRGLRPGPQQGLAAPEDQFRYRHPIFNLGGTLVGTEGNSSHYCEMKQLFLFLALAET